MPPFKFLILQFQASTTFPPPPSQQHIRIKEGWNFSQLLYWFDKENTNTLFKYWEHPRFIALEGSDTSLAFPHSHGLVKWWFMPIAAHHRINSNPLGILQFSLYVWTQVCKFPAWLKQMELGCNIRMVQRRKKKRPVSDLHGCAKPTFHSDLSD